MGIKKILRFLILLISTLFIISCKQNVKKSDITEVATAQHVEVKQDIDQTKERLTQKDQINFVKDFYTSYLTGINNSTFQSNFDKYLSQDLIKYINSVDDGDLIINAQDYEKFDLNRLKILETSNYHVYEVRFINMGNKIVMFAKVKLVNDDYKITNLSEDFDDASKDLVLPEFMTDEYYFESLSYYIEPTGESKTGIVFKVEEDFEGRGIIFSKNQAFGDYFKYLCTKTHKKKGLEIYHKKNIGLEEHEYKGDTNKPLITIYKKGEDFYATSPLIEDGKEIKLEEE